MPLLLLASPQCWPLEHSMGCLHRAYRMPCTGTNFGPVVDSGSTSWAPRALIAGAETDTYTPCSQIINAATAVRIDADFHSSLLTTLTLFYPGFCRCYNAPCLRGQVALDCWWRLVYVNEYAVLCISLSEFDRGHGRFCRWSAISYPVHRLVRGAGHHQHDLGLCPHHGSVLTPAPNACCTRCQICDSTLGLILSVPGR